MDNTFQSVNFKILNFLKLNIKFFLMNLPNFILNRRIILKKKGFNNWENFNFTGEKYYINKHVVNIEKEFDYIIDIGANIGEWTQLILPKKNKKTKIIMVEPQIKCLEKLKILKKKFSSIYILNRAVSDKNKFLDIYFETPGSQLASLVQSKNILSRWKKNSKKKIFRQRIKSITIQKLYKKFKIKKKHKVFLKIDVEGIEDMVLINLLNSNINFHEIMFEFNPQNYQSIFNLFENLKKKKFKFKLFKLLPFKKGVEEIVVKKSLFPKLYCNLLLKNLANIFE